MFALDSSKTLDLLKVKFYVEWLYSVHVYAEGESGYHKQLTSEIVKNFIDPLKMPLDFKILDLGCGPGYFLDEMKSRGYTNCIGVTLSPDDIKLCESKGHTVKQYDLSFLPGNDGYHDESVDFIFLRHALEHSPFPIISLIEYNRILKQNRPIYIEVPAPDCDRKHEWNPNHYSILGKEQLLALLDRTGFSVQGFQEIEFDLNMGTDENGNEKKAREKFYALLAFKTRPLDLK